MNIAITGSTGFLGKYLVELFESKGFNLIVIGRDIEKLKSCFNVSIKIKESDYSLDSLTDIFKDIDVVIHLASQLMQRDSNALKLSDFFQNIQLVENVLLASQKTGVSQCIITSSISTYSGISKNFEINLPQPSNIYGLSKLVGDMYASYFQKYNSEMSVVNLRLARLYGHGERGGLMFTNFIDNALNKETLLVNGDGSSTIQYVYIKDVVSVFDKIVGDFNIKGIFNIGNKESFSVREVAETINQVFNNVGNINFIDGKQNSIVGTEMSVSKAKKLIDWEAQWSLFEAIKDIKFMTE